MLSSEALSTGVGSDLKHSIMQLVSYCVSCGNVILIIIHAYIMIVSTKTENSDSNIHCKGEPQNFSQNYVKHIEMIQHSGC